ncbi:MAG: histidine kinase, partial [Algicola sp.]|nr:histidine kinase [Algicola sp.]
AIIAVDSNQCVTLMNPAAEKLFNSRFEEIQGWPIKTLGLQEMVSGECSKVVEFSVRDTHLKEMTKKVYLRTDEYFEKGIRQKLIFITDIQDILREEERQAWQKLLRVLSHEINNTLAPISSISETLSELVSNHQALNQIDAELGADLTEGLAVITERANSLNQFIQSYQQLSRLPPPDKTVFDIEPLMRATALLFDDVTIELIEQSLSIYADQNQLQQVIINLVKNARESMQNNPNGKIELSWETLGDQVKIQVLDEGGGIDNPDNLFIPFYTTKEQGSGIGLVLSRQIIINHGGDITVTNRANPVGAVASVYLPHAQSTMP